MKTLTITKSFYYSVGKRFGWKAEGYSEIGVGIAKSWLIENEEILVNVDKKDYHLDCKAAVEFIRRFKSYEDIKGVRVGYVSKDLLKEYENK